MIIKFLNVNKPNPKRSKLPILALFFVLLFSCNQRRQTEEHDNSNPSQSEKAMENIKSQQRTNELKRNADSKSLKLLEGKIIFDENFNPFLIAKLKNNLKIGIIALELVIDPNEANKEDCQKIIVKRKISIPPGQTVGFKEKINSVLENGCGKIEDATISLGDFILKNGEKTNSKILFFQEAFKDSTIP